MQLKNKNETVAEYDLAKAHLLISVVYILVAVLAGLTFSLQFIDLYPFKNIEWLSPGRVRMVHTQAVAFAWLANAFFGVLYYMIPKLTGEKVYSKKMGWFIFYAYNFLILATVALILGGHAQGLEWAETPKILDPFIAIVVVMLVVNFFVPIFKARHKPYYVSIWYVLAALIWTPIVYVFGNFLPQYVFPGTGGATISSMYIHDLVGLFVTPIGTAMIYYLLPVVMKRPLFSHALSLIGFWGLAFFYPLNSTHHYLYSPIPMWSQYAGIIASVGVHIVVYTVVFNIIATVAGDWKKIFESIEVKFLFTGILCYLITCIQCAIQVTLSVQKIIHFTDWVVGHSHFVLFGVFSFFSFAWIYYLIPRLLNTPIYSVALQKWHYWLSTLGIFIMQIDLLSAGLVQGYMWKSMAPFIDSVTASIPFWWVRTFSGVMILVGTIMFIYNIFMTWKLSLDHKTNTILA